MMVKLSPLVRGTFRYEFVMVARRRSLWLATVPLLGLVVIGQLTSGGSVAGGASGRIVNLMTAATLLMVPGIAVLLADVVVRVRRLHLVDLLESCPADRRARVAGTVLGSLAMAVSPTVIAILVFAAVEAVRAGDAWLVARAVGAVACVLLPSVVVMVAIGAVAAVYLPIAVARAGVVGLWFWASAWNSSLIPLPSPTGTLLSPYTAYVNVGWFGAPTGWAGRGAPELLSPAPTAWTALLSLALIIVVAVAMLYLAARAMDPVRASSRS
ncbi:MAG: hypothetical protein QG608_1605 [Actinomycetota bacterium]|nr:hypothetical protein [Actinomycetota bacterium]